MAPLHAAAAGGHADAVAALLKAEGVDASQTDAQVRARRAAPRAPPPPPPRR